MNSPYRLIVVGMGLDGIDGLTAAARLHVDSAKVIAGSPSHLALIPSSTARQIALTGDMGDWLLVLKQALKLDSVVLLASGDPLFFGIGRLLIEAFAPEELVFHPHLSSVQLAFNRLHLPWQEAEVISVHGRSLDRLERAIKQGKSPVAVLTDGVNTPGAIAKFVKELHVPTHYKLWVCSHLGGSNEAIASCSLSEARDRDFPMPNVTILQRESIPVPLQLPLLGLDDADFLSFRDRPGLMTKQEIRALSVMLLNLQPGLTVWDVGAGTGALAIEIARLIPQGRVIAIEKTAAGIALIEQNSRRFQVDNVEAIAGRAPDCFQGLPQPDRMVLGGGGNDVVEILKQGARHLTSTGTIVSHFATLEACAQAQAWFKSQGWNIRLMQVNISRAVPIANATRWSPLNPVMLLQARSPI